MTQFSAGTPVTCEAIAAAKRFRDFWLLLNKEAEARGMVVLSQGEARKAWDASVGIVCSYGREGPLTREEWQARRA